MTAAEWTLTSFLCHRHRDNDLPGPHAADGRPPLRPAAIPSVRPDLGAPPPPSSPAISVYTPCIRTHTSGGCCYGLAPSLDVEGSSGCGDCCTDGVHPPRRKFLSATPLRDAHLSAARIAAVIAPCAAAQFPAVQGQGAPCAAGAHDTCRWARQLQCDRLRGAVRPGRPRRRQLVRASPPAPLGHATDDCWERPKKVAQAAATRCAHHNSGNSLDAAVLHLLIAFFVHVRATLCPAGSPASRTPGLERSRHHWDERAPNIRSSYAGLAAAWRPYTAL